MAHSSLRRLWLAVGSIPDCRLRLLKCSLRRPRLNKAETVGSGSEFLSSVEDEVGPFLTKWTISRSDFRTYLPPSTGSNLSVKRESISPLDSATDLAVPSFWDSSDFGTPTVPVRLNCGSGCPWRRREETWPFKNVDSATFVSAMTK